MMRLITGTPGVAPFAGAWIETVADKSLFRYPKSRPSRARGLKLASLPRVEGVAIAPFAGAWIETTRSERWASRTTSRPSRARGLKQRPDTAVPPRGNRALRGRVD